ncbi:MAG TPA: N-acetyl sugar amidotransferase [Aurantimonas coralicida]|uniref:N-acetyl sugar amidotransferase n=2 Tax=root TaxID=1 RepID=A0A9C9NCT1_9HYPH|nr:N-acetyl sugar amidotransferase [Aurantimonas coralicida]HET99659.1 N-acetyl sugar amidotransferase [Aurantimonas coralicida]
MTFPPLWSAEVEARVRAEARNLDSQERPQEVRFCTRCVVSNQRPRIRFDDYGVCSACQYAERKKYGRKHTDGKRWGIDWAAREAELKALLDKHRRSSGYDVIVPCSGGKDSSMIAYRLKHEYGMHPLCVRFAPFMETEIGRKNWESLGEEFDRLDFGPAGNLHRKLARLAFEFYGDPFQPFVYGQLAWPMWAAVDRDVGLVMYGENGEAEYGGDPAANDKPCWDTKDWDRVYSKGAGIEALLAEGVHIGAIMEEESRAASEFYRMPSLDPDVEVVLRPGTVAYTDVAAQFHWFGYYRRWHPQENYYYASEHTGFEANEERSEGTYSKYASLDDKLDGFHYFMAFVKFGIGRATSDAAHEVRDGDITREEAIALVKRYDGEFPGRHLDECLDYLGMDRQQLEHVIDRFRAPHVWDCTGIVSGADGTTIFPVSRIWQLKHAVYDKETVAA